VEFDQNPSTRQLRVVLSTSQGKIRSSTILRKLGTESRKNRLYLAFRVLDRVVRTCFLLHIMHDEELQRPISAATNIAEAWNGFVQWVAFGGEGVIRQNNLEEQRKIIRFVLRTRESPGPLCRCSTGIRGPRRTALIAAARQSR
jgi:TnpA family transposase